MKTRRFLVEVTLPGGGVAVHPMKEWLRRNPGHLPPGMSPASSTSHQLRAALKRRGWRVKETSGEVSLPAPPSVAAEAKTRVETQPVTDRLLQNAPSWVATKPWWWEGNVVHAVAAFLIEGGWTIEATADTARREAGPDIKARRRDQILVVEVKGYPSTGHERGPKVGQPKRTNPPTQGRHWVAEALMTAVLRQADGTANQVALAFPDFGVYRKLLARLEAGLQKLDLQLLFVSEAGDVHVAIDRGISTA